MTRRELFWAIAAVASTESEMHELHWDGTADSYYRIILGQMQHAEAQAMARFAAGEKPPFDHKADFGKVDPYGKP